MRAAAVAVLLLAACDAAIAPAPTLTPSPTPAPTLAPPLAPTFAPTPTPTLAPALAPTPAPSSPSPTRRPGAYANTDPDDDLIVGPPDPLDDCEGELARAGVRWRAASLPVHVEGRAKLTCGAPQVVVYERGPGAIVYSPPPLLTCSMALALASFEKIVQDEASRELRSPVVRVEQLGTYSCRQIVAFPGWVSEHSYANAIDLARFVLKNGTTIDVQRDFDLGDDEPRRPGGRFLRSISRRAFDEDVFSHVLTPFFNAAHRNHFHLDLARYRGDGTRPDAG